MSEAAIDFLGSEELTEEERNEYERLFDNWTQQLESDVNLSQEAKLFLNSKLGKELRKFVTLNKMYYLKLCASAKGADLEEAQLNYEVMIRVEQLFGQLLTNGIDAHKTLEQLRGIQ